MHIIPHLNCKTSVFLPLVCNWIICQLQKGAGWVLSVWKMKKSPSVKGRNNLTKPAVSCTWFSRSKMEWVLKHMRKNWLWFISSGSQNASQNLGATWDIWKTAVPAPRNSQYPHYHIEDAPGPAWEILWGFIWVLDNLVRQGTKLLPGLGLGVPMVSWPSNHHAQCSFVGPHCNTASLESGVSQGN